MTVPGRNAHRQSGIRIHCVRKLATQDVVTMRGMRITPVARTICDLAAAETSNNVEAAFQEALYRDIVTPGGLARILAREPRRKGARLIRALLDDPRMTRSERERTLLRLIDTAELPRPLTNVRLHGHLVDAYWPAERLVIEFDGWQAHGHRHAFERDRKFDQVMLANGLRSMRVTDHHLQHEPVALIARIAQSLKN